MSDDVTMERLSFTALFEAPMVDFEPRELLLEPDYQAPVDSGSGYEPGHEPGYEPEYEIDLEPSQYSSR